MHPALREGGSSVSASHWAAWSAGQDSQASQGGVAHEPGAGLGEITGVTCKHSKPDLWGTGTPSSTESSGSRQGTSSIP